MLSPEEGRKVKPLYGYESVTRSSSLKKKKKVRPVEEDECWNDYSYAKSTYALHDSIIIQDKKNKNNNNKKMMMMKNEKEYYQIIKNLEKNWISDKSTLLVKDKSQVSDISTQSKSHNVLYHCDYPFNITKCLLTMEPLEVLILMGYAFCDEDESECGTNVLIAQDIFKFLAEEICYFSPCLSLKLMRHNFAKRHIDRQQYREEYSIMFDIRIAFRDKNDEVIYEVLYCGSKYDVGRSFLSEKLNNFLNKSSVSQHFLHESLLTYREKMSFPKLHHLELQRNIREVFGYSNELASEKYDVLDNRDYTSHPVFKNGTLVKLSHITNKWGGIELYNLLGNVRGCFTESNEEEYILYVQLLYDRDASFIIESPTVHCFLVHNDNNIEHDCPEISIPPDGSLPFPLKALFATATRAKLINPCSRQLSVVIPSLEDFNSSNALVPQHIASEEQESDSGAVRAALFNYIHELAWRSISICYDLCEVLQQAYSETILTWIEECCVDDYIDWKYKNVDSIVLKIMSKLYQIYCRH